MKEKRGLIVGIVIVLIIIGIFLIDNYFFGDKTFCTSNSGSSMTLNEAREIAGNSECVETGTLTDEITCNENTGTIWINLDAEIPDSCFGVSCVVNVETKESKTQWMCGGLISE